MCASQYPPVSTWDRQTWKGLTSEALLSRSCTVVTDVTSQPWQTSSSHSLNICLKAAASTIHRHQSWHDSEWLDSNRTSTKRHRRNQPHSHRLLYWLSSWHQCCAEWTHSAIDCVVIVAAVWVWAFVCGQLHFFPPVMCSPGKPEPDWHIWANIDLCHLCFLAACLSKSTSSWGEVWFLCIWEQFNSCETSVKHQKINCFLTVSKASRQSRLQLIVVFANMRQVHKMYAGPIHM